ncbi:OB-fold domain-containing protein [Dactylosporangium sp. AC04546]|uniref:Zn-ribbon domain-containing OB-fold protein n=1 Tax=Dactylosporangium sp. AC04546 TaxID=2862460 RepID=UPI001EE005D2|nr:OB-fold domain-containing protein [Dactylosporangium sp. AC04546]WVK86948.1 OB-fold domain-containing protein [Dactylosporangium sp. AC04546]
MTRSGGFPPATRDDRSAQFFDTLAEGTLLLRRCVSHGHLSAPEVLFCAECGSPDLEWTPSQGGGHVVTWTAIHSRPDRSGATVVSAIAGIVELHEGPWLRARLLAADPAAVRSGAAVRLEVVETDGESIYAFRIVG